MADQKERNPAQGTTTAHCCCIFLFYFFFLSCYKFGGTEIGMEINWGVGKTGCDVLFSLGSSFFFALGARGNSSVWLFLAFHMLEGENQECTRVPNHTTA
jgi:hypothetical protein